MILRKLLPAILIAATPVMLANSVYASPSESEHKVRAKSYKYASKASLQASVSKEVMQDRLTVTVSTELSESTQQKVSQLLNQQLNKAMKLAKENNDENIKITSGSYYVWPMNDKDGNISNWRGNASILIESSDFELATNAAHSLQEYMTVSSLNFFVSPKARAQVEHELLTQVSQAFDARATALTKALGFSNYRIDKVDLGGRGTVHYDSAPRVMSAAMQKSEALEVKADTETISLDISGTIYLLND